MASKTAIQIRTLTARQTLAREIDHLCMLLGVEPVAVVTEPSHDPAFRQAAELERLAAQLEHIAAAAAQALAPAPVEVISEPPAQEADETAPERKPPVPKRGKRA